MKTRKILSLTLLFAFANNNLITYPASWSCRNHHVPTHEEKQAAQVNVRRKYADSNLVKSSGLSYGEFNKTIENTATELLKERYNNPSCQCFEQELEQRVVNILHHRAQQHNLIKPLSSPEVRQRIEEFKLKLRRQYTKPDQLAYYKTKYQDVVDYLEESLRDLFGYGDLGMETTEAQLDGFFKMCTNNFIEKLNKHRNSR